MNTSLLKTLALSGGDWVIWLLGLSSVVAVAVMIERGILVRRELGALETLTKELLPKFVSEDLRSLEQSLRRHPGAASRILQAGLTQAPRGVAGVEDHLVAASLAEKRDIERRLLWLGTLGNNAPFIGLFGTVLGVIRAFHDLASSAGGPEVVMQGLSEALIATAVGLVVAIPCVVAYNYFTKRAKDLLAGAESLGRLLLARLRSEA